MIDYSFLRFKKSLAEANDLRNSPLANILHSQTIQLDPNGIYLQITNTEDGIVFNSDYKVELIDCNDNVLADITNSVAIYEFIDRNGVNQIAFELYKLGFDFYSKAVHLKFTHTTGDDKWYSNPFLLTAYNSEYCTEYDYKHHAYFHGISYDRLNYVQSIRLAFWFDSLDDKTEVTEYYQISNGNTVSNRALYKQAENYKGDLVDNFAFERMNVMFIHSFICQDFVKVTNKPNVKSNGRIGRTNIQSTEFQVFKDYNQNYLRLPQIYELLALVDKYPQEQPFVYSGGSFSNQVTLYFNKNITLNTGTITVKDSSDNIVFQGNENDFVISGIELLFPFSGTITDLDTYTVEVSAGLVEYSNQQNEAYTWQFSIVSGEFDYIEFDNNEFLV